MRFQRVRLAAVAHHLPEEVVTSAEVERRLAPLYERLRLPEGRLELISGVRERRFFPPGSLPGDHSIVVARAAIAAAGLPPEAYGACLHGSVCRDCLEPATACRVHHALGLPRRCVVQDVSNACLGLLSATLQAASMIELGQIDAAVVVGAEDGRALVENTIDRLNRDMSLGRDAIKSSFASLTIGSAAAALVLCHDRVAPGVARLSQAVVSADTQHHTLCRSEGLTEVMNTDSERLLRAGVEAGAATFEELLEATGWPRAAVDRTFCHQVGVAHRKAMLGALGLPLERDYPTVEFLGNTGSAALPVALSMGAEEGLLTAGDRVALLGIGSGVNCLMAALEWGAE